MAKGLGNHKQHGMPSTLQRDLRVLDAAGAFLRHPGKAQEVILRLRHWMAGSLTCATGGQCAAKAQGGLVTDPSSHPCNCGFRAAEVDTEATEGDTDDSTGDSEDVEGSHVTEDTGTRVGLEDDEGSHVTEDTGTRVGMEEA